MATLPILGFEDSLLRKKSRRVPHVNRAVRKTLDHMIDTMRTYQGVGLAAPQIGLLKRIIVVDVGEGPYFLVNPEIVFKSEEEEEGWEGCLSWPGYMGQVSRASRVTVRALDRDGHETWVEGEGFLARALQHEIDHLDGILFVDRATTVTEITRAEESSEPEKSEDGPSVTTVFLGSPDFAVPSLDALCNAGVSVSLVITQPDRPFGRRQVLRPTPVKEQALRLGLPVLTVPSLNEPGVIEKVRSLNPDFISVVAFGQRIPREIIDSPKYATLNVHPSLLPSYRGGNPVQRAVMAGDKVTGVSIIYLSDKMDAGDICLQRKAEIGPGETFGTLEKRLAEIGAHALLESIDLVLGGEAPRIPQDDSKATFARHLGPGEDAVNWNCGKDAVHNLVRGLSPRPGAVTSFRGKRIKVWETCSLDGLYQVGEPGAILGIEGDALVVSCKDGVIGVSEVQPDGKKVMSGKAFYLGRPGGYLRFGTEE